MPIVVDGEMSRSNKKRKGNPIRAGRSAQADYVRSVSALISEMQVLTRDIGQNVAGGLTPSQASEQLELALFDSNTRFKALSDGIATRFVGGLSEDNKEKIQRMLKNALGVDSATYLDAPAVAESLQLSLAENVNLIKTIPEQHFSKVSQAVYDNYRGVQFNEGSLQKRLAKIGKISQNRAKFIARDQSAKLINGLNEVRMVDAGIEEYVWRTQKDERVVGNKSGLYPTGTIKHRNHFEREGRTYKWTDPPADGHPSEAIGCRCFAEPVVNLGSVKDNVANV